jgi:putative endopeptidase
VRIAIVLVLAGLLFTADQPTLQSGLDVSSFDRSIRPQDDLYRFVNGRWLATAVIPADRVTYSTFIELADRADDDVRRIIERLDGRGGSEQQIATCTRA